MKNLILYGAQCLSNDMCIVSGNEGGRGDVLEISRVPNTRSNGSTVVNKRTAERNIRLQGAFTSTYITSVSSSVSLEDVITDYKGALDQSDRYLRISREWLQPFKMSDISMPANVTTGGDAVSPTAVTYPIQLGRTALRFNVDVSASANDYSTVESNSFPSVSMSSVSGTGHWELWVYIPNALYVTSLEFRVGSGSGHYYSSRDIVGQYDGALLQNGWNYVSVPWSSMSTTGTPNVSALTYFYLKLSYSASQADMDGVLIDGIIWQNDDESRNYKCYCEGVEIANAHYENTHANFAANFVNYTGRAIATASKLAKLGLTVTTPSTDVEIDLGGVSTQNPELTFTYTLASNLSSIDIYNLTTQSSVNLGTGTVSGDQLIISTDRKSVYKSGSIVDYSYVLPTFNAGKNTLRITHNSNTAQIITQPTLDLQFTGDNAIARAFTPTNTGKVTQLQFYARLLSGTARTMKAAIFTNSAGAPGTLVYLKSWRLSSPTWTQVVLDFDASVTAATQYWFVIELIYSSSIPGVAYDLGKGSSPSASPAVRWGTLTSSNTWTDGGTRGGDVTFTLTLNPTFSIDYNYTITNQNLYL